MRRSPGRTRPSAPSVSATPMNLKNQPGSATGPASGRAAGPVSRHRQTEKGPPAPLNDPQRMGQDRSPPWRLAAVFPHGGGYSSGLLPSQAGSRAQRPFALVAREATPQSSPSGRPKSKIFVVRPPLHPSRRHGPHDQKRFDPHRDPRRKRSIGRVRGTDPARRRRTSRTLGAFGVTWSRIVPRSIG